MAGVRDRIEDALSDHDGLSIVVLGSGPGARCICGHKLTLPVNWKPRSIPDVVWNDVADEDERAELRSMATGDDKLYAFGDVYLSHRVDAILDSVLGT